MSQSFQEINIFKQDLPHLSKNQPLDKGLALVDLDGTIRTTKSGNKFINNNSKDQQLITKIPEILKNLNYLGYTIVGISNQGGILAQYKTLRNTIKEMRYLLNICPHLDKIYFAMDNGEVWIITRNLPFLDALPLNLGTLSRYSIYRSIGENSENFYQGFYKPSPGMLQLAIAQWANRYDLLLGLIDSKTWIEGQGSFEKQTPSKQLNRPIFMAGDRDEDRQAAEAIKIDFIEAKRFQEGFIIN